MATNAIELNLTAAIDNTEQKEDQASSINDDDAPQQTDESVECAIKCTHELAKHPIQSPKARERASSEPEGLNRTIMLLSSPLQRRFSTTDMNTEEQDVPVAIEYEEPPTRQQFTRDMFIRDMTQMLSKDTMIKPMHNTRLICYVYDGGKIKGPHTCDEIISLYVYNQIQDDILYISSATANKKWYKLEIPRGITWRNKVKLGAEYLKKNSEIKTKFPELYNALIINIIKGKLTKIAPPLEIPEEVQNRKSIASLFVPFLGKTVAFCTLIIVALHIAPFIPLSFAYRMMCIRPRCCVESVSKTVLIWLSVVFYIIMFCGFLTPPFITTWLLVSKLRLYDEIQSWMIAYIVWGIFTFMVLTTDTI
eukprot:1069782_1